MKNDIMIGDWLYSIIYNQTLHKKPIRVTGIRTDTDNPPHIQGDDTDVWYGLDTYEPIPLIEEILQKNFPDPSEIVWFPLDTLPGYFNIYWEHPSFGDGEIRLNIQYVHELQHILKLCNINKEIVL
jgi:hypothetical protein